jgi:hypothetical protein
MEQWSNFRAKWRDEQPGTADIAMNLHGLVFKARVKGDDLVSRGMLVALCSVSNKTVSEWISKNVIPVAAKRGGIALFKVRDAYKVARERGTA